MGQAGDGELVADVNGGGGTTRGAAADDAAAGWWRSAPPTHTPPAWAHALTGITCMQLHTSPGSILPPTAPPALPPLLLCSLCIPLLASLTHPPSPLKRQPHHAHVQLRPGQRGAQAQRAQRGAHAPQHCRLQMLSQGWQAVGHRLPHAQQRALHAS